MQNQILRLLIVFAVAFTYSLFADHEALAQDQQGVRVIVTQSPKIIVKTLAVNHNKCYGESKGAINIDASGGYPPYKYYWSHGDTTQDVAGLKAGTYRVAVYDDFSCSDTVEITVKEPEPLIADVASVKPILCYGYNHGAVDITVRGGTPPYAYSWNNGAQTEDIEDLTSGRYSALITDANGCQEITMADVEEKPLIVRSLDDVKNILCHGDSTGSVDISVSGGVPPYSYQWNNGSFDEDLSDLKAGVYEVVVKDSEGCTEVSTTRVIEPDPLQIGFDEIRDLRCNGDFGGAININVEGGRQPYYYKWNNGAETQDIAGIPAGHYSVEVKDNNGCLNSVEAEVAQPEPLNAVLVDARNVLYHGGNNGSIDIDVTGGVAPYKYKWSNGSQDQDISGLEAGAYSVRITDATGCAKLMNVAITQPAPLLVKIDEVENIKCHGENTGRIAISVYGGIPPYSYAWSNGAANQDITSLKAGNYSVTVTDANGFTTQIDTTLTQPPAFNAQIVKATDILCHNEHSGAIDLDVEGGVLPYRYRWSNGQETQDLKDVPAGDYSVRITDANHCEQNLTVSIRQPESLIAAFNKVTDIACYGNSEGAIDVSISGGVAPYQFQWNNGAKSEDLANAPAGKYNLTVTDSNGCVQRIATEIKQPDQLSVAENLVKHVDCFGNSSGAISVNVAGGVKPYSFLWSHGATTQDVVNLQAGDYSVTVKDANGCETSYSATITQPGKLVRELEDITHIACYDEAKGAININVSGGVTPYQYKWSNGAVTQDLVDVKAGHYKALIRDANGCIDSLDATINQSPLLNAEYEVSHITCHGQQSGAVALTITGGVAPYTYKWSNGATSKDISGLTAGNYSVIITDSKGCQQALDAQIIEPPKFIASLETEKHILCHGDQAGEITVRVYGGVQPYAYEWSNGASTKDLSRIPAGEYKLTATDANGCVQVVNATINQPSNIEYSVKSITHVSCYSDTSGAVDIAVSGGVGPYLYRWSNGSETQDLEHVKAGKYQVQLKDANGCLKSLEAEITQPPALTLRFDSVANILCHGERKGAIDLSVAGGAPPYKYSWSNGATTEDISSLPAGSYTVTVTDAHACAKSISAHIKQPPALTASIKDVKHLLCNGDTDGAIFINVEGGVKPYVYKWSNGRTTQDLTDVGAGSYSVAITDAHGCTQTLSAEIIQPEKLVASLTETADVSCYNGADGEINITVNGGTTPYRYTWSNGSTFQDLNGIPSGVYSVGIADAKACKDTIMNIRIDQPAPLQVSSRSVTHIARHGQKSGAIDIDVAGGTAPYRYSWSNGATTQDLASVAGGIYSVNVVDAQGCEQYLIATINQPPPLMVKLLEVKDINCSGDRAGEIQIEVSGGAAPYTFAWSNGDSTQNISGIAAGEYTVTVADANGNTKSLTTKIAQPSPLIVKLDAVQDLLCFNDNNGAINVTTTGGIKPYVFEWSNGEETEDISSLSAGTYSLTVTDGNECKESLQALVSQPEPFKATMAEVKNVSCKGDPEGEIRLTVTGGVKPYSYFWNNGEKTKDIVNMPAGDYSVKIADANGCSEALSASITEPEKLIASVVGVKHNLCFDEHQGEVAIKVDGGTQPYQYAWSNGDSTSNLTGAPSGSYTATITDAKGCEAVISAEITQPQDLTASVKDIVDVNCFGDETGQITVDVSGGVEPYVYKWSSGETRKDLTNIASGLYQLTVSDKNGCSELVEATVAEPTALTLTLDTVHHILCYGDARGFIDVTVRGGKFPYAYTWSNGSVSEDLENAMAGHYTINVKDANGCRENLSATIEQPEPLTVQLDSLADLQCAGDNKGLVRINAMGGVGPYTYVWNNGARSREIANAPAGIYKATVTDANGCDVLFTATVEEPPKLIAAIDAITDIRCFGENSGSISVHVLEGVEPYSFEWNNGATTKDLRGVKAGKYTLTITEGNGCESILEATVEEPTSFTASVENVTDVRCHGDETGAIDITANGGVQPYVFAWSNGAGTEDIQNVGADSYSVMVTDGNGCIKTLYAQINQPEPLSFKIDSVKNVKCCGDNSGAIYISVDGGVKPYNYQWSNGAVTEDIENLVLGEYTVVITDAHNCVVSSLDEMTLYEQVVTTGKFITRDILFDVAKSTIKPESFTTINKIASFMKEHPEINFRIDGHTDSDGSEEFNQRLSEERAEAIRSALIKFGIRETRLSARGYGESTPVASNDTAEGKAQNRRVEFISLTGTIDGSLIDNQPIQ